MRGARSVPRIVLLALLAVDVAVVAASAPDAERGWGPLAVRAVLGAPALVLLLRDRPWTFAVGGVSVAAWPLLVLVLLGGWVRAWDGADGAFGAYVAFESLVLAAGIAAAAWGAAAARPASRARHSG